MNKATILKALHRYLVVCEVQLEMLNNSAAHLWNYCDPDNPATKPNFISYNKVRNKIRSKRKQIYKVREAISQVKKV